MRRGAYFLNYSITYIVLRVTIYVTTFSRVHCIHINLCMGIKNMDMKIKEYI